MYFHHLSFLLLLTNYYPQPNNMIKTNQEESSTTCSSLECFMQSLLYGQSQDHHCPLQAVTVVIDNAKASTSCCDPPPSSRHIIRASSCPSHAASRWIMDDSCSSQKGRSNSLASDCLPRRPEAHSSCSSSLQHHRWDEFSSSSLDESSVSSSSSSLSFKRRTSLILDSALEITKMNDFEQEEDQEADRSFSTNTTLHCPQRRASLVPPIDP